MLISRFILSVHLGNSALDLGCSNRSDLTNTVHSITNKDVCRTRSSSKVGTVDSESVASSESSRHWAHWVHYNFVAEGISLSGSADSLSDNFDPEVVVACSATAEKAFDLSGWGTIGKDGNLIFHGLIRSKIEKGPHFGNIWIKISTSDINSLLKNRGSWLNTKSSYSWI